MVRCTRHLQLRERIQSIDREMEPFVAGAMRPLRWRAVVMQGVVDADANDMPLLSWADRDVLPFKAHDHFALRFCRGCIPQ